MKTLRLSECFRYATFFEMSLFLATCGPTGVGKTYQMQRMLTTHPKLFTTVRSITTRPSRGVLDEGWYRCVTREEMDAFDPRDVISEMEFRGERYVTLQSEIESAFSRAPIALMAIVPSIIMKMRGMNIAHSVLNCKIDDRAIYEDRLRQRGYSGEKLLEEKATGLAFPYPPHDPAWPQSDVFLCSPVDDERFDEAVSARAGDLFPRVRV